MTWDTLAVGSGRRSDGGEQLCILSGDILCIRCTFGWTSSEWRIPDVALAGLIECIFGTADTDLMSQNFTGTGVVDKIIINNICVSDNRSCVLNTETVMGNI